jgi:hypothetical protein
MVGEVEDGEHLIAADRGIKLKKLINSFAGFYEINEALHRNACSAEARSATHPLRIDPNRCIETNFVRRGHNFNLGSILPDCKH